MQQNNQNTNNQFLQLPYTLLDATGYIGKGGEVVPITLQQKVIYCWMKQRCEFFAKDQREYFDNIDDIADSLKINRKTVMQAIQSFTANGVLIAEKKAFGGVREKWVFKRFFDLKPVNVNTVPANKKSITQKEQIIPTVETPKTAPKAEELPMPYTDDERFDLSVYDVSKEVIGHVSEAFDDDFYAEYLTSDEQEITNDAFDYDPENLKASAPVPQPDKSLDVSFLQGMPLLRYTRAGKLSADMISWFVSNGYSILSDKDCAVEKDGKTFLLKGGKLAEGKYTPTADEEEEEMVF